MKETDFATLLCSRLCHDLISPVSAVSNGIDILNDEKDADMREQVLDLIKKSALQTSAMVQFYRVAFGSGGGLSDDVELETIKKTIENFTESKKIKLNWYSDFEKLSKKEVRLLLNIVLFASESLVRGGDMDISLTSADDDTGFKVEVQGQNIILYPAAKTMFNEGNLNSGLEARTAPISLVFSLLNDLNAKLSLIDNAESEDKENNPPSLAFTAIWPSII